MGECKKVWGSKFSNLGTFLEMEIFWWIFVGRKDFGRDYFEIHIKKNNGYWATVFFFFLGGGVSFKLIACRTFLGLTTEPLPPPPSSPGI